jgi:hypothetical protein
VISKEHENIKMLRNGASLLEWVKLTISVQCVAFVCLKGLCHQFRSSWKYCHSKATNIGMWLLILKNLLIRFLILYPSLKFLCLGSKLIQIIIFILNMLRRCSMRIQNTREQLSMNPIGLHKERRILLADS